jgi:hypothetical protein
MGLHFSITGLIVRIRLIGAISLIRTISII